MWAGQPHNNIIVVVSIYSNMPSNLERCTLGSLSTMLPPRSLFLISLKNWKPFQSCFRNDDSLIWRNYFWWEIKGEPQYVCVGSAGYEPHSEKNFKGFLSKSLQLIDWSVGFWRKNKYGSCGKTQWVSKIFWSRNFYILLYYYIIKS